jgi:UPF0716 protein FxsA
MVALLRLLLLLWPVAEIVVVIVVAEAIGIGWTVLALLGAGLAGLLVIRVLGAASLVELRRALERREPPAGALLDGACVLLAGLLLILPGFIGDAIALLLLIKPLRAVLLGALWRAARRAWTAGAGGATVILDGEYHEMRAGRADRRIEADPRAADPSNDEPGRAPPAPPTPPP